MIKNKGREKCGVKIQEDEKPCQLPKGHGGGHLPFIPTLQEQIEQSKVIFQSGAASSKIPRYDLIPPQALRRIAKRFELGVEKHKERSWNARSKQDALSDKEWVIARAAHAIDHALKYLEKLTGVREEDGDDDGAAIAWAGICLIMADEANKKAINEVYDIYVYELLSGGALTGWLVKDGHVTATFQLSEKESLVGFLQNARMHGKKVNDFILDKEK